MTHNIFYIFLYYLIIFFDNLIRFRSLIFKSGAKKVVSMVALASEMVKKFVLILIGRLSMTNGGAGVILAQCYSQVPSWKLTFR